MTDIDEHGRAEPPVAGAEVETLLGFLDYQRATFEWKTRGLGADGLSVTTAASTLTLGGLMKHFALVEDNWFTYWLLALDQPPPFDDVDWDADPDWEFHTAVDDEPNYLRALWRAAIERSRAAVAEVLGTGGLDAGARRIGRDGQARSLRWIVLHMIEEYARHNGHADLLREAVDGEVGE